MEEESKRDKTIRYLQRFHGAGMGLELNWLKENAKPTPNQQVVNIVHIPEYCEHAFGTDKYDAIIVEPFNEKLDLGLEFNVADVESSSKPAEIVGSNRLGQISARLSGNLLIKVYQQKPNSLPIYRNSEERERTIYYLGEGEKFTLSQIYDFLSFDQRAEFGVDVGRIDADEVDE